MDFGIGSYIKNKVSKAIVLGDDSIREEIFLSFVSMSIVITISVILISLFFGVYGYNLVSQEYFSRFQLTLYVFLVVLSAGINQVLSISSNILAGAGKAQFLMVGGAITNSFVLLLVAVVFLFDISFDLSRLVYIYCFSFIVSGLSLFLYYYNREITFRPSSKKIYFRDLKRGFSQGLGYFLIQISALVIFMSDRFIISSQLTLSDVSDYEVVYRLFSIFFIAHNVFLNPFWPFVSKAYYSGDTASIKNKITMNIFIVLALFFGALLLHFKSEIVFRFWLGESYQVSNSLTLAFCFLVVLTAWSNIYGTVSNAIGDLRIQICTAIIAATINIPLSLFFVNHLDLGLTGVVYATVVSLSIYALVGPFHIYGVLNRGR
jgi:O-antigen/teichoic acid export membrane protein